MFRNKRLTFALFVLGANFYGAESLAQNRSSQFYKGREAPLPQVVCEPRNETVAVKDLPEITCVSGDEVTEMILGVVGVPLTSAWPGVQDFIATVNVQLMQAKAGHRFSDRELADLRKWSNEYQVEAHINYPMLPPTPDHPQTEWLSPRQQALDYAFINKGLKYLSAIYGNEIALRNNDKFVADAAADKAAKRKLVSTENALLKRASAQCPGKIRDFPSLATGSPYADVGYCYKLPMVVVGQWINAKTALVNLAMIPTLLEFTDLPDTQFIPHEVVVKGEGAYQYQSVDGALRTIPKVRLVAQ